MPTYRFACATCGVDVVAYRGPGQRTPRFCGAACYAASQRMTPKRFWTLVEQRAPADCWPWLGYVSPDGYGHVCWDHRDIPAHRRAFELANGPVAPHLEVCHACDNRRCCNPAHLFVGTTADNAADRNAKGREARGERSGHTRLTDDDVRSIWALLGTMPQTAIARRLGVSPQVVNQIVKGKAWRHVTPPQEER